MDSSQAQSGGRQKPARYEAITEEEFSNDGEYADEVWPVRPPSSTRRYQGQPDIRHETGRAADVQPQTSQRRAAHSLHPAQERPIHHTIPQRRTATPRNIPALTATPSRIYIDEDQERNTIASGFRRNRQGLVGRFHWLVFVGLAMIIMIFGWFMLSALGSWWQTTQDDWHYGR